MSWVELRDTARIRRVLRRAGQMQPDAARAALWVLLNRS